MKYTQIVYMCSSHYLNYTCFYSLYTDITLKLSTTATTTHHITHLLSLSLLTLGNRLRPLHLITHRLLPLGPMLLIQLQRRHSILQMTMWHTILLNDQSQLILRQHLQLLGNKVLPPVGSTFINGSYLAVSRVKYHGCVTPNTLKSFFNPCPITILSVINSNT